MSDAVLQAVQERIRAAAAAGAPLAIRGGGTRDFYGEANVGRIIDRLGDGYRVATADEAVVG